MDRIISYLTSHTEFNVVVKYATLSDYFEDVNNEEVAWPSYSFGDFLVRRGRALFAATSWRSTSSHSEWLVGADALAAN